MNFGAIPESWLERIALRLGLVPIPLIDALFGPLKARLLMTGVAVGLFEALSGGSREPDAVARELGLDPHATRLLCRALAHVGYLRHDRSGFGLSPLARRSLVRGGADDLRGYLEWNARQWRFLEGLEELVRTGRGVDFHNTLDAPGWHLYERAMLETTRRDAATLATRIPVPAGAAHLLDLGGGHGALGAALCRRHPPLRSTVIDLPEAVRAGQAIASDEGYAALVSFQAGDLRTAILPPADVVLLSNVLHHLGRAEILDLFGRVRATLPTGGVTAVWEIEAPAEGSAVSHGDVAALFFRLTSTADTPAGDDYAEWLSSCGFIDVTVSRPRLLPGRVLVVGRRGAP